jgi:hypothetical protein
MWSLWLSSLVVGYATIVWMIGQPAAALALASWRDRATVDSNPHRAFSSRRLTGQVLTGALPLDLLH